MYQRCKLNMTDAPSLSSASNPTPIDLPTSINEIDANNDAVGLCGQGKKLKSRVWDEFHRLKEGKLVTTICKYCDKQFQANSVNGTSHLRFHINRCSQRFLEPKDNGQQLLGFFCRRYEK